MWAVNFAWKVVRCEPTKCSDVAEASRVGAAGCSITVQKAQKKTDGAQYLQSMLSGAGGERPTGETMRMWAVYEGTTHGMNDLLPERYR
eukprot:gene20930-biopygen7032